MRMVLYILLLYFNYFVCAEDSKSASDKTLFILCCSLIIKACYRSIFLKLSARQLNQLEDFLL